MNRFWCAWTVITLSLGVLLWPMNLASAEEARLLAEIDALRIEKAQLEVQFLEERVARLKERAVRMLQDIQRQGGVEGWTLDLDARRWNKPDPPKQEGK